ncbi:MAG: hypothetical protein F6J87_17490 [Spirulina sp. SIO3F2]|nr:hypothetical protein [Spirulina sp. SIO3F2]
MPECPVCETTYVKGKAERCHVCGWQLEASGFSMLGPVKIEHQLSRSALTKIEAWAHHMWTTIQQQKKRIAQLQAQPRQRAEALPTVTLHPSQPQPTAIAGTLTDSVPSLPTATPAATTDTGLLQWVLSRLDVATQERSQLKFQVSQLRAELQRLQAQPTLPIPNSPPQSFPPTLAPAVESTESFNQAELNQQLQQTLLNCQAQVQEAIAPWISTTQLQQQTLLALQNTVQTLQAQSQSQAQTLQTTQQQLQTLSEQLTAQPQVNPENIPTIEWVSTQIGAIEQQFTQQVEQQLTALETELLQQQIPQVVHDRLTPLKHIEQQLELQKTQQQQALEQLHQRLAQLQSEVNHQRQQSPVAALEITAQRTEIETLAAQVQALEAALAELSLMPPVNGVKSPVGTGRSSHTVYRRYQ